MTYIVDFIIKNNPATLLAAVSRHYVIVRSSIYISSKLSLMTCPRSSSTYWKTLRTSGHEMKDKTKVVDQSPITAESAVNYPSHGLMALPHVRVAASNENSESLSNQKGVG